MTPIQQFQDPQHDLTQLIEELRCLAQGENREQSKDPNVTRQSQWVYGILKDLLPKIQEIKTLPTPQAQHIHAYLISHLHQGPTLKDLAQFLGYSEKYCSQIFHTHMGESFSCYIKKLRMERAKSLLQETQSGLTEIARAIGFSDQFAFSHFFKKAVGCSPRDYRERQGEKGAATRENGHQHGISPLRVVSDPSSQ